MVKLMNKGRIKYEIWEWRSCFKRLRISIEYKIDIEIECLGDDGFKI